MNKMYLIFLLAAVVLISGCITQDKGIDNNFTDSFFDESEEFKECVKEMKIIKEWSEGEILVVFKEGVKENAIRQIMKNYDLNYKLKDYQVQENGISAVVNVAKGLEPEWACELKKIDLISEAMPRYIVKGFK